MRKEMNRLFIFVIIGLFLFSTIGFVVAQGGDAAEAGEKVNIAGRGILDFLASAIGLEQGAGNPLNLLTYLFMGIILFLLIYSVFETMALFGKDKRIQNILISVGVTFLTLIALPADFFSLILPSYGAMGGAILTIIPFLIIFWFSLKTRSLYMARMTWIIFAFYFLAFYIMTAIGLETESNIYRTIYVIAGLLGVAMIFFIPMIRDMFKQSGTRETVKDINRAAKINRAVLGARTEEAKALKEMSKAGE